VRTREARLSTTRGLGLGLYITKGLVEAQGGRIWAESNRGDKTSFYFTLPLAPVAQLEPVRNSVDSELAEIGEAFTNSHIFLVDDSVDSVLLLEIFFKSAGAKVTSATSAVEAMQRLATCRPDVILTDIEMPGVDGFELLKQIRQFCIEKEFALPVVAVTGHTAQVEIEKILAVGFDSVVVKPIKFENLTATVQRVVARNAMNKSKNTHHKRESSPQPDKGL